MAERAWMRPAAIVATLATALLIGPARSARAAEIPPELAALEQQMAHLQVSSERFTFQEEVATSELLGAGIPLVLIVAGRGEASDSPPEASFEGGLLGTSVVRTVVVGEKEWTYEHEASEVDGGRPWVRRSHKPSSVGKGIDPGGILEDDESGSEGTFTRLVEELNEAQSVVDSGPVTVDDERVIEFDASINPAPLVAQLETEAKARSSPGHPLDSLLPELSGGSSGPPSGGYPPPSLGLEVFIAPDGLPVRLRVTFSYQGATVALRVDTLAINVPVQIAAPPAPKTIGEAKLQALQRRRAERELKRALRACKHLRGARARECRAAAHGRL